MQNNLDDLPVGQTGKNPGPSEEYGGGGAGGGAPPVDNSGPLEQRLVSKNWLVRANAFEELATAFKNANSQFDQEFREHASTWKKYLADTNPGSLEKCLDACEAFINRADPKLVSTSQNDIIKILIEKCVGHTKPAIKNKSLECFALLFEVTEAFDDSIETMTESLNSKNAKISQTALVALNFWLASYGVKKIKIKTFLPIVENAAGSSNPTVRAEAMTFYKECYKWLGENLKPLITNLKKQQQDDLEKEFVQLKDKPKPELRLTRAEKERQKEAALDEIIKKEEEEKKGEIDAFDLVDAVNLLKKYGANEWQEKILELKNWKEKKDMLEELLNDSNVPKIQAGDFSGITKVLKKMMSDSNIVVSQTAVKVCGNLAKGLRKDFESCCKELVPSLMGKFKEKKTQVIDDVNQVLQNFMLCTNLENILQEVTTSLNDKAPTVKRNVCLFIEKAAQMTYIDVLQRISGELLQALIKASDDSQGEVRDAALQALGIFKGRLGDSAMSKFLSDLNQQKLQKLNESAQNVKPSKYDRPEKQEKKPEPKAAAGPAKKQPAAKKASIKKQEIQKDTAINEEPIQNNFDEQPIGGGNKAGFNAFDEQPIGGGNKGNFNVFDEQPIGGGGNKGCFGGNQFDEQPIGGGKGGFNPNDMEQLDAFGGGGAAFEPPKKKPPARLAAKKPAVNLEEEKKEEGGDVIMNDDNAPSPKKVEPKKPPAKQPPELKSKPSTTSTTVKATTSTKGPSGPQIQEEDIGAGLSKEEAEAKVNENFPSDIVSKFEESKWQDKVEGFKGISEQVIALQPSQDVIEALAKFVKMKMKDWKESNINLIKETINLFNVVSQNCEKVNKRAVACLMPFLSDKIGDVKLVNQVGELLLNLAEIVTPKYIALQVIKYASSAKSPNVLKESCNILIKMTDEFSIVHMPLKEMIDYATVAVNHSNPQVRTSAMALFAIMYQHAGETIKNFLKDIKESTLKLIEDEFGKVTPLKKGEHQQKRKFRGMAAETEAPKKGGAGGGGGGLAALLDDALPRQDISKQLTGKLMPMFKHNDWKVRKEAAEKVEEMCRASNMRIKPDGLNELMDNMKQRMSDPNKAVLKSYIQLMGVLVEALGPAAKQFQKKLLPGMLATLADKQSLVRQDAIACMDKWAEHVGPEVIINNVGPMLSQENPELRSEALKWIIKQKEAIKTSELKEIVKPLVSCLSDKTPAIRNMAEEVCTYVMPLTGYQAFQAVLADLLPAVSNSIKPILEKVKQKVGTINVPQDQMNGSIGGQQKQPAQQQQQQQPPPQPTLKSQVSNANQENKTGAPSSAKPQIKPKQNAPGASGGGTVGGNSEKPPQQNLNQSLQPNSTLNQSILKKKENQTPSAKNTIQQRSESKEVKQKGLSQTINQFKQPVEEPQQDFINVNFGFKERRMEFDKKTKFQLEEVKGDQLDKLKSFTSQSLGASFCAKMFSNDFKLHVECIESFNKLMQHNPEALREILDIIFKWSLVKLADSSNTKFAVSVFDFYSSLFLHLEETEYSLWDFEANIIIPLLCEKTGINNNILKDKVKKLIKMIYTIYDTRKCYLLIVQYGLNSKNLRAQAECLDELSEYLGRFGTDNCSEKEMKLVAKMADNSDKSIRENALKFMGEAYKILDDNIWRAIGDVTPKVQGLLEQRFKKIKGAGGAPTLTQSSSSSNFMKAEGVLQFGQSQRDQSPKSKEGFKTQQNFGLKKSIQQTTDMGKQAVTPRGNLQFNRASQIKQDPAQQQNLSRSINQFNQSNRSNDGGSKLQNVVNKQDSQKKLQQQPEQNLGNSFNKKPIPQTQRIGGEMNQDFNIVQRSSEPSSNNFKNSQFGNFRQTVAQNKNTQMFYTNDDDDEDLRILTDDNFGTDPEMERAQEEIAKHIHQLKYADLSKRVDSLVSLNEMISAIDQNKPVLVKTANDLVSAFTHVLNDIFDKNVEDIPLRFAKYFITIVLKTCSCKEIMREVNEDRIFDLAEQLLTRLLIENLDKVGDNKEGELILKNLNSSMLRLLENCNHTYIFCVLFNLLRKYKDYGLMPKLPNLIIKCLLKLSKILEKLIDKLDMEKILLAIHEYLVAINHENKTQNDEMGIRIVKTVTNELVKLKRESIWEAYRVIQCHGQPDNHIYRWIQIILKSLQTQGTTPNASGNSTSSGGDFEIRQIVEELRNPEKFETAIPKLQRFLDQNPHIDLNDYLQECSKTFQQFIKTNLEKHKLSLQEEGKQQQSLQYGYQQQEAMKSTGSTDNDNISIGNSNSMGLGMGSSGIGYGSSGSGNASGIGMGMGLNRLQQQPQEQKVELKLQHANSTNVNSNNNNNNSSSTSRISEYQSKLASFKMRNNQNKSGTDTGTNKQQQSQNLNQGISQGNTPAMGSHNLNTSFSAMNSSLSQKWHEINKKSAITKREGTSVGAGSGIGGGVANAQHQMSATMGGFTQAHNNFESKIGLGQNANHQAMNQSLGSGDQNLGSGGATNQDLNKRLAEMKAKLQALKKK